MKSSPVLYFPIPPELYLKGLLSSFAKVIKGKILVPFGGLSEHIISPIGAKQLSALGLAEEINVYYNKFKAQGFLFTEAPENLTGNLLAQEQLRIIFKSIELSNLEQGILPSHFVDMSPSSGHDIGKICAIIVASCTVISTGVLLQKEGFLVPLGLNPPTIVSPEDSILLEERLVAVELNLKENSKPTLYTVTKNTFFLEDGPSD
jgi:hypothetical protein